MPSTTKCSGPDAGCECIGCRIARMVDREPDEVSPNFILDQLMLVAGSYIIAAPDEMHRELLADCQNTLQDVVEEERTIIRHQGHSLH